MSSPENPPEPAQQPRAPNGRFLPGQSANPGGRPAVVREVRNLARQYTEAAVLTLVSIAADRKAPAAARVSACAELLNRGHGRPEQAIAGASLDLHDVPEDFTPANAGQAVTLYEQLMAGLVTADSASAAMARASFTPDPSQPMRQPTAPAQPPTEGPRGALAPCAAPRVAEEPPRVAPQAPRIVREHVEASTPERPEEPAPERDEGQASAAAERELTVAERYAQLSEIQADSPLPPPTGPARIA